MKFQKAKNIIHKILNGSILLQKSNNFNFVWIGSDYGGFYICPDRISHESCVYSFGIGEDISFDTGLISKYGCLVYAYDPTPRSIEWIANIELSPSFRFFGLGIGDSDRHTFFYLPKNTKNISGSLLKKNKVIDPNTVVDVEIRTLKTFMMNNGHKKINVLKLDIEGAEYEVIDNIIADEIKPDQILLEFHSRFFKNGIFRTLNSVRKLKKYGYELFAISENGEEMSFILSK